MLFNERIDVTNAIVIPLNDTANKHSPHIMNVSDVSGSQGSSVSSSQNSTEVPSYGATTLLMSVPNPKRTVPVNFFNLSDEDSFSPFQDETAGGSAPVHKEGKGRRPGTGTTTPEIFEYFNDTHLQSGRTESQNNHTSEGNLGNSELDRSRGIIGSARKSKSSNSNAEAGWTPMKSPGVLEALGGDEFSVALHHSASFQQQVAHTRSASLSPTPLAQTNFNLIGAHPAGAGGGVGAVDRWDSLRRPQAQQAPICRPSSTPAYSSSVASLFGGDPSSGGFSLDPLSSRSGVGAGTGSHAVDDLLSGLSLTLGGGSNINNSASASANAHRGGVGVRGRDREYSFGSLLGLSGAGSGGSGEAGGTVGGTGSLLLGSNSSFRENHGHSHSHNIHASNHLLGTAASGGVEASVASVGAGGGVVLGAGPAQLHDRLGDFSGSIGGPGTGVDFSLIGGGRGSQLRSALLSAGGTMSAPPQFLVTPAGIGGGAGAYPSLELGGGGSSSYGDVAFEGSRRQAVGSARVISPMPMPTAASAASPHLSAGASRGHSPTPVPTPTPSVVLPVAGVVEEAFHFQGAECGPSSVELTVLRSCREILAGAAEHSLKAVELANTLRARVGTESLARVREQWGGLLSLLEKHSAHFRVDRIPKNDKVTLLLQSAGHGGFGTQQHLHQQHAFEQQGSTASSTNRLQRSAGSGAAGRQGESSSAPLHSSQASSSYLSSASSNSASSSSAAATAGATRCLHVGNVPANMTEVQLVREFEKFGQLDGLKLVSQRNGTRRFAFITFRSVDQAISARHCLSKVHPWKSAISFAHKEFSSAGAGTGAGGGSGGNALGAHSAHSGNGSSGPYRGAGGDGYAGQLQQQQQQHMQMNSNMMMHSQLHQQHQLNVPNSHLYQQGQGGLPEYQNNMMFNHQQLLMAQQQQQQAHAQYPFMQFPGLMGGGMGMGNPTATAVAGNSLYWMQQAQQQQQQQQAFPSNLSSPIVSPLQAPYLFAGLQQQQHQHAHQHQHQLPPPAYGAPQQQQQHTPTAHSTLNSSSGEAAERDCPVLQRLCDDTYVPTQPWPVDTARDPLYCGAVVAQLQQFGGCTTISKLRGFLRNRVAAVDNIKSVPLKAMLVAYPHLFLLENNYVYLVNSSSSSSSNESHSAPNK